MKLVAPFILLLAVLGAVVWLDDPADEADFSLVNASEVFTLDPQRMSWMQDFRLAYALYEPLVRWDNDDFSFLPAACVDLPDVSDDRLTYTFRLRGDVRWSNGAPVTAHDYVYSWRRAMLADTAADYTMMFFCIEGAENFFDWRQGKLEEFAARAGRGDAGSPDRAAASLWRDTLERFDRTVGLEAVDDRTLGVTLARPTPYFLDLVAFGVFHPVYRPCVEGWRVDDSTESRMIADGWHVVDPPPFPERRFVSLNPATGMLEQKHEWTKPEELVTNGPYVLARWRYKRDMRLERNPHFHSPEMVVSDSVGIVAIPDPNTAVMAFERGQIDWLTDVSVDYQPDLIAERKRYEARHAGEIESMLAQGLSIDEALAALPEPGSGERRNVHVLPTFGTDFYSFNCRPELADGRVNPFHSPAVRRAFVAAVDREAIVSRVTRLNEPVVTTLVPPGSIPGYDNPEGIAFDPEYARAQMADAGWIDQDGDGVVESESGEPFPVVDLLYSTNTPRYKNISLALRDMWRQTLGVQVELRGKENKTFKEDLKQGNYMVARGRWYGDYGDPTTFLDINKTGDGNNDRGYSNAYVDDLLDQAAREPDPDKRMDLLEECERYLFQEDPPMLVICNLVQLYMYEPGEVTGISRHPRLSQYLWELGSRDDDRNE